MEEFIGGILLFRHGARYPLDKSGYNKCLYKNWSLFNGELTEVGKKQIQVLGKYFNNYLKKQNFKGVIKYNNSDLNRCVKSREIFINELKKYFVCEKIKLKYPQKYYFRNYKCEKNKLIKKKYNIFETTLIKKTFLNLINLQLKKLCKLEINYDCLECFLIKLKRSEIANSYYLNDKRSTKLLKIPSKYIKYKDKALREFLNSFKINKDIGCGKLPELIKDALNVKNDFWVLAVHDTTIHYLLAYYKINDFSFCNYGGYIQIEIWKKNNKKFIKFYYNNKPFEKSNKINTNCLIKYI